MPAYRRKPGTRLPPRKLRDQPSRAARIFRRKKQTPFRVSRREYAIAFDGLPRSSFPLAFPGLAGGLQQQLQPKTKVNRRPSWATKTRNNFRPILTTYENR